ncbi:vacuolar -sorting-associated 36 isoform X1 [Brachionus plicatilis]|uniref:Vacuolar protein-sorting-associated protein 36 n=1 Tax=Brachionus plicatilis TaxID=10195 RepID=A0A3M7QDE6_BRAPC|nr:vacuolar -sorting-associated 36 isoform X1 [Brachionus plicatilis]
MNCVKWSNCQPLINEEDIYQQAAVTIYNLEEKTGFQKGRLQITSHRLLWFDQNDRHCVLEISLSQIKNAELKQMQNRSQSSKFNEQLFPRIRLLLEKPVDLKNLVDDMSSYPESFVFFEFEYGGHNEFFQVLNNQMNRKKWNSASDQNLLGTKIQNIGVSGIQRQIQDRLNQQDQQINESFKDLSKLMNQAKEMVNLSNVLISKINKSALNCSENEESDDIKKLKGYFLNMGLIDNPVTKESSGSKYHKALALEINNNFSKIISEGGGIMTLADLFCRLNRARGIAGLISAEDLLIACKELNKLNYDLKYSVYKDLNLHVVEINSDQLNKTNMKKVENYVERNEYLTPYALSKSMSCSLIVAKKLLLDGEKIGKLCRDETNIDLRFYKNKFLHNSDELRI